MRDENRAYIGDLGNQKKAVDDNVNGVLSPITLAQMEGVWTLLSLAIRDSESGEDIQPWGMRPEGRLIYTSTGRMCVIITADDRHSVQINAKSDISRFSQLYTSMIAYAGTYILGESGVVTHRIEVSSDPSLIETDQIRHAHIENGILHLVASGVTAPDGSRRRNFLSWQRIG